MTSIGEENGEIPFKYYMKRNKGSIWNVIHEAEKVGVLSKCAHSLHTVVPTCDRTKEVVAEPSEPSRSSSASYTDLEAILGYKKALLSSKQTHPEFNSHPSRRFLSLYLFE